MKQRGRKTFLLGWVIIFTIAFTSVLSMPPGSVQAEEAFDVQADSAILLDAETGKVLFAKNIDESLPPASMSKMMTEFLVLEAIDEGEISWDTPTEASEYAHYLGGLADTSRVWLAHGEERTVEELYTAMAVYSANDATVALAELVAGSEEAFVEMMNEKAEELGMTDSQFVNSTGLPNRMLGEYIPAGSAEDENAMSAKDTALLARELVNHYPQVLEFSSIPAAEPGYYEVDLINFNWMLAGHPEGQAEPHTYAGVDGLKTGFTDQAGYCFTGTAQRDDMRLISVVMKTDSMGARFEETAKLLDYGFDNFVYEEIAVEGDAVEEMSTMPVAKGKEEQVSVVLGESLTTLVHEEEVDKYTLEVIPAEELINDEGALTAPLATGDVVGEVHITYSGDSPHDFMDPDAVTDSVPLVAAEDVQEAGWFSLLLRSIGDFFSGLWTSVVEGVKGWFS